MAKFVTEDGREGISGDKFMMELQNKKESHTYTEMWMNAHRKTYDNIRKLKVPSGRCNGFRLDNMNMYDLLSHMQSSLSQRGLCVIELITNEQHKCLCHNENIQRRINIFADQYITDSFKDANPRKEIRIIKDNKYEYRMETDAEWYDRLCYEYMERYYPTQLKNIKCEECLQQWMNSDKW